MKKINLIGCKFGRLTVIEECKERDKHDKIVYKCICDCGKIINISGNSLRQNKTKSCGCLRKEVTGNRRLIHGKTKTRLYRIWQGMKTRCYNKNNKSYLDYGGRGIKLCDEWLNSFDVFSAWAVNNGYQENLTIDRINNDGNYEPSNCHWITNKENCNNTRKNVILTYNNKTQTIAQWADELNISYQTLHYRYKKGWDTKDILFKTEDM